MDVITAIKKQISIVHLVAPHSRGLRVMRNPKFALGYCPFHQQRIGQGSSRRPKFWVNIEQGLCNCFVPHCRADKPMDVINFWARLKGIDNKEAIRQLWEQVR